VSRRSAKSATLTLPETTDTPVAVTSLDGIEHLPPGFTPVHEHYFGDLYGQWIPVVGDDGEILWDQATFCVQNEPVGRCRRGFYLAKDTLTEALTLTQRVVDLQGLVKGLMPPGMLPVHQHYQRDGYGAWLDVKQSDGLVLWRPKPTCIEDKQHRLGVISSVDATSRLVGDLFALAPV
jgi:hypothetical protein